MRLSESPGTAVMISHNGIRFTQSAQCFAALQLPPGSRSEHCAAGLDLAFAREAIAERMTGEWLYFVDDDTLFAPDTVLRLLRSLDEQPTIDIVAAFVLRRWPPHYTVAARQTGPTTATMLQFESGTGLLPVDLTGLGGGAVIRRTAFNRVPQPWFTHGPFTEDWRFCARLKQAGGQAAINLDVRVGHITPIAVWPSQEENGQWGVAYTPVQDGLQAVTLSGVQAAVVTMAEPVPA